MKLLVLVTAVALSGLPAFSQAQCGDPLRSTPIAAMPGFQKGFSIVDASLAGDTLCLRVMNRKIPRWVDIYVEGVTAGGNVVELAQGTLGPPDTHLFFNYQDLLDVIDGTWEASRTTIYPPFEREPMVIPNFSRYDEVRVKCYGLGFDKLGAVEEKDFFKILVASTPTVVFEILYKAASIASGAKLPEVELRGRPQGDAIRKLSQKLLERYQRVDTGEARVLFQLYKSGEMFDFATALVGEVKDGLIDLYAKDSSLVHDALAEMGLDRKYLPKGIRIEQFLRLNLLKDVADGAYALTKAALAAALSEPVLTFVLKPGRPLPILYVIDTSGSMGEGGKMDQVRRSGAASLRQAAGEGSKSGTTPVVEVMTFSGACSEASARTILPFTTDLGRALSIFESGSLKPGGETPLPQAVQVAKRRLATYLDEHAEVPKGQLVILSDGESTCGPVRPSGTWALPTAADGTAGQRIEIQTVGFHLQPGSAAERDLQYLASANGGRYYSAGDQRRLARVFEKLVDAPDPKPRPTLPDLTPAARVIFAEGVGAILTEDFKVARAAFSSYLDAGLEDPAGHYNLALTLEATERYLAAAGHYERYAALASAVPDAEAARRKAQRMREDREDHLAYQVRLLRSDLSYLESYYESLFNRSNDTLATEFESFLREKGEHYSTLPDALEIREPWLERAAHDLASGFGTLAERLDEPTFDRDAVSLLTVPIAQLEEIVERLEATTR
ncbi:MAG TPA: vWA domain-containing protein [Thermoanaerobaculia bacterium]|nr:vWA domain-containing protein [Thermoanaerobaculia bacterium]